jgi:hypothetical protein
MPRWFTYPTVDDNFMTGIYNGVFLPLILVFLWGTDVIKYCKKCHNLSHRPNFIIQVRRYLCFLYDVYTTVGEEYFARNNKRCTAALLTGNIGQIYQVRTMTKDHFGFFQRPSI